jgi:hypothetical protein
MEDNMPYPMTHLYIAKKLLDNKLWSINNQSQYYLGSLVPDAVECRSKYDKKESHLCNDEAKWGFVTNYEKWAKNVFEYYKQNVKTNDHNFLMGYCCHILADINYSNKIWTPFRVENENRSNFNDINKISHDEGNIVDQKLFQRCLFKDEIWMSLNKAICFNFMGIVNMDEMEKMRNNVLNIQYKNKMTINSVNNKVITYESLLEYIENTIEYITDEFIKKI